MERYDLFLSELTELCRKHDIEICVNVHTVNLSLLPASDLEKRGYRNILKNNYKIIDYRTLDFKTV